MAEDLDKFYQAISDHVQERVSELEFNRDYTLKMICAKEVWESLDNSLHTGLGRYISVLVKKGMLPLVFVGKTPGNANLYRRR
jgi:hypothetical protein